MNRNAGLGYNFNNKGTNATNVANAAITNIGAAANTAFNNIKNTGANIMNSFFPTNAAPAAAPAAASVAAASASKMNQLKEVVASAPWGLMLVMAFLITIVVLIAVFYDRIRSKLSDLTGRAVTVPAKDAKGEEQNPEIQQKAAAVVNALIPGNKEVFHVADNLYAYEDAEPLCKAMGAELATYEQVHDAWKKGADWCSYGWVKGQSAVYPTSEETWTKLQQGPDDQKMACGAAPGLNGGYFDNPALRFGVNCYGSKPAQSAADAAAVARGDMIPQTPDVIEYNKKVAKFRSQREETAVAPFNAGRWAS
jgi:hypothetical protein